MPGFELLQVPPDVALASWVVKPIHNDVVPVIIPGFGFTVTVIVNAGPAHEPDTDVGTTKYSTVPAVVILGFDRT
jgi:hypothetical protein